MCLKMLHFDDSRDMPDCKYSLAGVSIWRPAVRFTARSVGGDFAPEL